MNQGKAVGRIAWIALGLIFLCVGGLLGAFGALYLLAAYDASAADPGGRLAMGAGLLVAGLVVWVVAAITLFLVWRRMQPKPEQKVTIEQQVELTGDVELASLACEKCAATLDKNALTVQEGTILVSCPHCGSTYQMVEEPKW